MPCAATWPNSASCRAKGRNGTGEVYSGLLRIVADSRLSPAVRRHPRCGWRGSMVLSAPRDRIHRQGASWLLHRGCEASPANWREIPGIGPIGATAPGLPRSVTGRHSHRGAVLAAWIGLVPKATTAPAGKEQTRQHQPNRAIDICGGCWSSGRDGPSSATRAPNTERRSVPGLAG